MQEVNYYFDIIVIVFYYSVGVFSIVASLFLIAAYAFYKEIRTRSFELIVYLSVSLIITNISYIMHYNKIVDPTPSRWDFFCLAQATLMTTGEISQTLFTTFIAYSIYTNIVYFQEVKQEERLAKEQREYTSRITYILVGFGIPLLIGLGFIPAGVYGKSNHWCWLATPYFYQLPDSDQSKPYNIKIVPEVGIVYYCLIWTLQITNYYFFFSTISILDSNVEDKAYVSHYIRKLIQFPLIQLFIVFPQTITKFLLTQNLRDLTLPAISVCLITVQGLLYSFSYGYNNSIRKKLKLILKIVFCSCCNDSEENRNRLTEKLSLKTNNESDQNSYITQKSDEYSGYSDDDVFKKEEKNSESPPSAESAQEQEENKLHIEEIKV